ncbi:hypothetical protein FF2_002792 [Malus domestica]
MGNWSQLCPTCKIIRPVRSKHCPTCHICFHQLHCLLICFLQRNKRDFFIFICLGTLTSLLSTAVAVQRIWSALPGLQTEETWTCRVVVQYPSIVAFLFVDIIILIAATTLTKAQATQIARNITTNELANANRYGYLRGPDGRFRNPYNHGCTKNCSDFLIQGHTDDDEIAWSPLQQVAS